MASVRLRRAVAVARALAAGAAILAAVALAGCASAASSTATLDTSPGAYPAGIQGSMIGACQTAQAFADNGNQTNAGYCECALKQIEAAEPVSKITDATAAGAALASKPQLPQLKQACGAF
jgi:hypothetical protein